MSPNKKQLERKVDELIRLNREFHDERGTRVGPDSVERQIETLKQMAAKNPLPSKRSNR